MFMILGLVALLSGPVGAATLDPRGVQVLDVTGAPRTSFTDSESIAFSQSVFNAESSANRILFTFRILNPSGAEVFTHTGNAAPGTPGQAVSRVSGVAIRRFWTGPGSYVLVAEASLDGNPLEQRAGFGVFSPVVTLLYPSDGARELQPPLALRWASSGSSRYRILVDDDPSFYNTIFTGLTAGPENFFDYPDNPSNPLERLSGGQAYYWKVEGLDANQNKIAESSVFSFTLRSQASTLARDLAITALEVVPEGIRAGGAVPFRILVKNLGGTTEPNVRVTLTLSGLEPPDSPKTLSSLSPGDEREVVISAVYPPNQANAMAFATVVLQDDNPINNFKQLGVARVEVPALAPAATGQLLLDARERRLRPEEAWNMIRGRLEDKLAGLLKGYKLAAVESPDMTPEELSEWLEDLEKGRAKVVRAEVK